MAGSDPGGGRLPMKIFRNGVYSYAVTRPAVPRPDGGFSHPQLIWGRIDAGLNFTPNKRFWQLTDEERDGIVIPPEWRIVPRKGGDAAPRPLFDGSELLYGHTWFLDMLADQCGLRDDLEHVFEDGSRADQVLSLAYYTLVESSRYSGMEAMQRICWFPCRGRLPLERIAALLRSVTEEERDAFLRCRRARSESGSWHGVVSTSLDISGSCRPPEENRWFEDETSELLERVCVLVVYDPGDGLPVHYRRLPGCGLVLPALPRMLRELREWGIDDPRLGFACDGDPAGMRAGLAGTGCRFVLKGREFERRAEEIAGSLTDDGIRKPGNWLERGAAFGKAFGMPPRDGKPPADDARLCLFLDPDLQAEDNRRHVARILELESKLVDGVASGRKLDICEIPDFQEFFRLDLARDGRLRGYARNEEAIARRSAVCGYFGCLANRLPPSPQGLADVLAVYDLLDGQEEAFVAGESEKPRTSQPFGRPVRRCVEGRLLMQFVALILDCAIRRRYAADDGLRKSFPDRWRMLAELRPILLAKTSAGSGRAPTRITRKQMQIFKAFKMPVPSPETGKD